MLTQDQIWRLFSKPEFVGAVLRYAALLEFDLDCLLCAYFVRHDRFESSLELLFPDIAAGRKLDLLRKLPVPKHLKSYQKTVTGLARFQRVRNIAAHQWSVSRGAVRKLLEDRVFQEMLGRYPQGLERHFRATRASIYRLRRVKNFGLPGTAIGHLDSLAVVRLLKDSAA